MEKKSDSERRASSRIEIPNTSIQYKLSGIKHSLKNYSDPKQVLNISKSGLSLHLLENVTFGDRLHVKINFPDGNKINLKGKIRWAVEDEINAQQVGILFDPFGSRKEYNPVEALEYLRKMKDQATQSRKYGKQNNTLS